jgi:hypothetical protein
MEVAALLLQLQRQKAASGTDFWHHHYINAASNTVQANDARSLQ